MLTFSTRKTLFFVRLLKVTLLLFVLFFTNLIFVGSYLNFFKGGGKNFSDSLRELPCRNNSLNFNLNSNLSDFTTEFAKIVKKLIKIEASPNNNKNGNNDEVINSAQREKLVKQMAILLQNIEIEKEMDGYQFLETEVDKQTLKSLSINDGGQPIRNIICSNWRSGSSFVGEVLNSHPATFYHYEPLMPFGVNQIRSKTEQDGKNAIEILKKVLNCDFEFTNIKKINPVSFRKNSRVAQYCHKDNITFCSSSEFLSNMCKLFPFHSMKTVRLRLRVARVLLEDPSLNIKLLYLVRDPRGTINSRLDQKWCGPTHPDCSDTERICKDLVDDFHEAEVLRREYPERFLAIRYEDVSLRPHEAFRKIFKFFRLQFHPKVEEFVNIHTAIGKRDHGASRRNSSNIALQWRRDLSGNFSFVESIQNVCKNAMDLWGYEIATDEQNLVNFNPVKDPSWEEMFVG